MTGQPWRWCLAAAVTACAAAPVVSAQPAAEPRMAVAVGPEWVGRAHMGGRGATLTRNPGGDFPLFGLESSLTGGIGAAGSVGVRVRRALWVEAGGRYHSARLRVQVRGDAEGADALAAEAVQQFAIDVGALWLPDGWQLGRTLRFFVTGGAGWMRQLHASHTLAEDGRRYYGGGGAILHLPTRPEGTFKAAGVRIDVRAAASRRGVAFDDRVHVAPSVWTGLFLRF